MKIAAKTEPDEQFTFGRHIVSVVSSVARFALTLRFVLDLIWPTSSAARSPCTAILAHMANH